MSREHGMVWQAGVYLCAVGSLPLFSVAHQLPLDPRGNPIDPLDLLAVIHFNLALLALGPARSIRPPRPGGLRQVTSARPRYTAMVPNHPRDANSAQLPQGKQCRRCKAVAAM